MKTNLLKEGTLTENGAGIGTVTEEMVEERAVELAAINARSAKDVRESDREQATRELTGEPDMDPKEALLESEWWGPVPGSTGHQARESSSEDTDDDGLSDSARLVEQGVEEAEHDQMFQAVKAEQKKDKS